ncbi:MAG: hypothetical protein JSV18_07275 [Candidatus Bathyarchaeota archaeon]|nr:MAG: hypothetical protein JSV18_07275 [Candidatus Bathyarchaeota archaeon]
MVSKKEYRGKTIYLCDKCGVGYEIRETAARCEEYCRKHNSCSIEITKEAVYTPKPVE